MNAQVGLLFGAIGVGGALLAWKIFGSTPAVAAASSLAAGSTRAAAAGAAAGTAAAASGATPEEANAAAAQAALAAGGNSIDMTQAAVLTAAATGGPVPGSANMPPVPVAGVAAASVVAADAVNRALVLARLPGGAGMVSAPYWVNLAISSGASEAQIAQMQAAGLNVSGA